MPTISAPTREVYSTEWNRHTRKVTVTTFLTIDDFRASMSDVEWSRIVELVEQLKGKRVVIVNSTLRGGGVVIMRKPLVALLQLIGVDVDWYVLAPNQAAFEVTKWSFHNVLQNVSGAVPLSDQGKATYLRWIADEAQALRGTLAAADVLICDDWQPSGLIPYLTRWGLKCKVLFRDHIHTQGQLMGQEGTPQFDTWNFLWNVNQVCRADVFVTHPRKEFVPPTVPLRKVAFMPATVDPLDDLIRELNESEVAAGIQFMNEQFAANEGQLPLDLMRRYLILVARFDESKFMEGALEYYARLRRRLVELDVPREHAPQLVLVGNGADDDPSGLRCLEKIMKLRRTEYAALMDDIKVARVPHNDLAINAILQGAFLALQPSIAEGFESRVTDAIWLGVPVLGSTEGGIPLQIVIGKSGYVLNPRAYDAWAEHILELLVNQAKYAALRESTREMARTFNIRFTTASNAISWLTLAVLALTRPDYNYNQQWADSLELESESQLS